MEIDEKKLKEILTEQREEFQRFAENKFEQQRDESQRFTENKFEQQGQDFQRYLGIQKEDFESKVQLIGEQYQGIRETLDSHTEMIGALMEDVTIIKSDVKSLKGAMEGKVNREEFLGHEKRISVLEAKSGR